MRRASSGGCCYPDRSVHTARHRRRTTQIEVVIRLEWEGRLLPLDGNATDRATRDSSSPIRRGAANRSHERNPGPTSWIPGCGAFLMRGSLPLVHRRVPLYVPPFRRPGSPCTLAIDKREQSFHRRRNSFSIMTLLRSMFAQMRIRSKEYPQDREVQDRHQGFEKRTS